MLSRWNSLLIGGVCVVGAAGAPAPEAAATVPLVKTTPPCGSTADLFFCAVFKQPTETVKNLSHISANLPGSGTATVTWTGTIFCQGLGDFPNYRVDFQIRDDTAAPQINGDGGASVGQRLKPASKYATFSQQFPLSLTRVFSVAAAGSKTFRLMGKPQWIGGLSINCFVNGGAMSVTYMP